MNRIAPPKTRPTHRRPALTLIDAVAALVVLGVVTVPIATGIASLSRSSLQNYRQAAIRTELVREAERLRAQPFANLTVGNTTTSIALPGGNADLTSSIALADYDGDLAADASFKLIVVTLDNQEIRFYRSDWRD